MPGGGTRRAEAHARRGNREPVVWEEARGVRDLWGELGDPLPFGAAENWNRDFVRWWRD